VSPRPGTRAHRRFVERCREIQRVGAREAGELGFAARPLVQANLPYRAVDGPSFTRRAGHLELHLLAPPGLGLPYGRYPRLFLAWLATQAVRHRRRDVPLGPSLSACLRRLDVGVSGGRHGPIHRFRDQVQRLLATSVTAVWQGDQAFSTQGYHFASESYLWWDEPQELAAGGHVRLSETFFREILAAPVPLDFRALRALKAPMAVDLYCWLTYRVYGLSRSIVIPWPALYEQFGSQYRRLRAFRERLLKAAVSVTAVYPHAPFRARPEGLLLFPGPPHVDPARS